MTINTFDSVSAIYAEARPGYPEALYHEIDSYKRITGDSLILEVGSGHGIATQEIHQHWQPHITAVEPGKNLYEIAAKQCEKYHNIQFVNCDYENYKTDAVFDCIVAATAFHWIDPAIKYKKSFQLLKSDGLLVLFWNNYLVKDKQVFNAIQEIYKNFHPEDMTKDIRSLQKLKIQSRKHEIENSGYFQLAQHKIFVHTLMYSTERYIKLLQSFSNNALPPNVINPFYDKMRAYVDSIGGEIAIAVTVDLNIAEQIKNIK